MIPIDEKWFDPSTAYTAEVRSKINGGDYIGTWSDWSNAVKWKTAGEHCGGFTFTLAHT